MPKNVPARQNKFQESVSLLFRIEYLGLAITVLGIIFWSDIYSITYINTTQLVAFFLLPDVFSWLPIKLFSKKNGEWPPWGVFVYNTFHSLVTWGIVFADAWLLNGGIYMPVLGWLLHISLDRTLGHTLRK